MSLATHFDDSSPEKIRKSIYMFSSIMLFTIFYKFTIILFIILLSSGCRLAGSIEGSGGAYAEGN